MPVSLQKVQNTQGDSAQQEQFVYIEDEDEDQRHPRAQRVQSKVSRETLPTILLRGRHLQVEIMMMMMIVIIIDTEPTEPTRFPKTLCYLHGCFQGGPWSSIDARGESNSLCIKTT